MRRWAVSVLAVIGAIAASAEDRYSTIYNSDAFLISVYREATVVLVLDTTHPATMELGLKFQQRLFELSDARVPFVDSAHSRGQWRAIYLALDKRSHGAIKYEIQLEVRGRKGSSANRAKKLHITYNDAAAAVDRFFDVLVCEDRDGSVAAQLSQRVCYLPASLEPILEAW